MSLTHRSLTLERDASRMEVIRVNDLEPDEAVRLLQEKRAKRDGHVTEEKLKEIIDKVGGRLSYINRIGRGNDLYSKHACYETVMFIYVYISLSRLTFFR